MRLRERDKRPVVFRERVPIKEPDGTTYEGWEPIGLILRGNVQPAGGRVMAEMYGERLAYMMTMYVEQAEGLESFGVWLNVAADRPEPDYKVIAVRPWQGHKIIDMEVLQTHG